MSALIHRLPEALASQIAACEVVQHPVSVVYPSTLIQSCCLKSGHQHADIAQASIQGRLRNNFIDD
jgi:hypothetical protein